jgi:large subunit ribosomal protein L24
MAVAQRKAAPAARGESKKVRVDLKKEDTVRVISGRDKGKSGRVLRVDRERGRILVEHVGMVKRHTRPNPGKQIKGGIAERESPISVSNVLIVCPGCNKTTRVGHHIDQLPGDRTRRMRVCRKCGQTLDKK